MSSSRLQSSPVNLPVLKLYIGSCRAS